MNDKPITSRCTQCGGENGHHFQTCTMHGFNPALEGDKPGIVEVRTVLEEQVATLEEHGQAFLAYLDTLGRSRKMALAKTNLEQALMWAEKHIKEGP